LESPRGARYPICGRIKRPAFPAPSEFQEDATFLAKLADASGEIAKLWLLLFEI